MHSARRGVQLCPDVMAVKVAKTLEVNVNIDNNAKEVSTPLDIL